MLLGDWNARLGSAPWVDRLEERGIHGEMLEALQKSYQKIIMQVKVNGKKGPAFLSKQGVKQGCPASPGLFGFFVEVVADYLDATDKHESRTVTEKEWVPAVPSGDGWRRVSRLFYADDLTLLATNGSRLFRGLWVLSVFCEAFGMRINIKKCEVLLFGEDRLDAWAGTRCQKCEKLTPENTMLLCDGCAKGWHMQCLTPPLAQSPRGKWWCPECRERGLGY